MPDKIDIQIGSKFDNKGFAAAKAALDALKKAQQGSGSKGGDTGAAAAKAQAEALKAQAQAYKTAQAEANALTAATRAGVAQANAAATAARQQAAAQAQTAKAAVDAERGIAQLAMAQARLASSQGNAGGAVSILQTALGKLNPETVTATKVQTQLQQAMNGLGGSAKEASGGVAVLPRTIAGFSGEMQAAIGTVGKFTAATAGIGAAIATIKAGYDFSREGASLQAAADSFNKLAVSAHTSGDALLGSMQAAAGGTVATSDIIQSTNTALLLLGNSVASKLPQLLAIAKSSATTLGTDVGKAFDDLITGVARGSTELIDNLGISISATDAQNRYAASVGKSASELTKAEKSQAVLNAVLLAGNDIIARTGGGAETAAAGFQRAEAQAKNLSDSLKEIAATKVGSIVGELSSISLEPLAKGAEGLAKAPKQIEEIGASLLDTSKSYEEYAASANETNGAIESTSAQFEMLAGAIPGVGGLVASLSETFGGLAPTMQVLSAEQYAYAQSLIATGTSAAAAQAQAAAMGPTFSQLAEVQAQLATRSTESATAFAALAPQMTAIAATGAYGAAGVQNLTNAVLMGTMTVPELASALNALQLQITNSASATAAHTVAQANDAAMAAQRAGEIMTGANAEAQAQAATDAASSALVQSLQAKQDDTIASITLKNANADLARLGGAVAGGLMTSSQAALIMADKYHIAYLEALKLISAQAQLGQLKNTGVLMNAAPSASRGMRDEMVGNQGRALTAQQVKEARDAQQMIDKVNAKAEKDRQARADAYKKANEKPKKGRGGGGGAKASPGAVAGEKLENIQENTGVKLAKIAQTAGEKLLKIDQDTQAKLASIDAKAAEQRAKIAEQLADDISKANASTNVDFESNDFELHNKDLTDERKKELAEREKAEVTYRQRVSAAQEEARQSAANGDAQLAKDILAAKTKEAADLMKIEQDAAAARANVAGGQEGALEADIAQAVQARQAETANDIALAQEASSERAQAVQDEKDAVLTAAQTQRDQVIAAANQSANETIAAAQRSAGGVKNATDAMVSNTVAGWHASASAIDDATAAAKRFNDEVGKSTTPTSGGGSPSPAPTQAGGGGTFVAGRRSSAYAAGGGTFVANKEMTITVGESGPEMLQVTPLGEPGETKVGAGWAKMAGGGTVVAGQGTAGQDENKWQEAIRARDARSRGLQTGGSSFDISQIDPADLDKALQRMNEISKIVETWAKRQTINPGVAKKFSETTQIVSDAVSATVTLRKTLMDMGQPADLTKVSDLVKELSTILGVFQTQIGKNKLNVGLLKSYAEGTANAIDTLNEMIDLRASLKTVGPPIMLDVVRDLAVEAREVSKIIYSELVKYQQEERDALGAAGAVLEDATGMLSNVIDLRGAMKDIGPPIMLEKVQALADEANAIVLLLQGNINPVAIQMKEELSAFADNVGQVTDTFNSVLDLRKGLAEPQFPITADSIQSLINDTFTVAQAVANLVPEGFKIVDGLEDYATTAEQATGVLQGMIDLRSSLKELAAPIDVRTIEQLIAELSAVVVRFSQRAIPLAEQTVAFVTAYSDVAEKCISALSALVGLRSDLKDIGPPITERAIMSLIAGLSAVVVRFTQTVIPTAQATVDAVENYTTIANDIVDTMSTFAGLGVDLKDALPVSITDVEVLATQLRQVVQIVKGLMIPTAEAQAESFGYYASLASDAVGVISDMAGLSADLKDALPIKIADVQRLANDAVTVTGIVKGVMVETAEEQADALGYWADTVSSSVGIVSDVAGLSADLKDAGGINEAQVVRLTADAVRVTKIVEDRLVPTTEAQATQLSAWGDAVASSVGIVSDVAGLSGDMLADYRSPTDSELGMLVTDAQRIVSATQAAASTYNTAGLEAVKAYGDGLGSVVSALLDTGKLVDTLRFGNEYLLDAKVMTQFEGSAATILEMGGRLSAVAATQDYSALPAATSALNGLYDSYIKASAVPWGDLPAAAGGLSSAGMGMSGGAGSGTTIFQPGAIVIQAAPGMNIDALTTAVMNRISQQTGARR